MCMGSLSAIQLGLWLFKWLPVLTRESLPYQGQLQNSTISCTVPPFKITPKDQHGSFVWSQSTSRISTAQSVIKPSIHFLSPAFRMNDFQNPRDPMQVTAAKLYFNLALCVCVCKRALTQPWPCCYNKLTKRTELSYVAFSESGN